MFADQLCKTEVDIFIVLAINDSREHQKEIEIICRCLATEQGVADEDIKSMLH